MKLEQEVLDEIRKEFREKLTEYWNRAIQENNGICLIFYEVTLCMDYEYYKICDKELNRCFRTWKYYTGNILLPVPFSKYKWLNWISSPSQSFESLHKWKGLYGAARRDLAAHIIKEFNPKVGD